MKSNYKKLGQFIQQVSIKNSDLRVDNLLGVSITKEFIKSIANIIGTDMTTYKIVKKNQFTYGSITSRNGDKISIALLQEDEAIVSTSYTVFEVIDINELLPEYLMMWFRRPEFDRYARYMSHGSTREAFGWEEMCDVELPIPTLEKQKEIIKEYHTITDRIKLNEQLSQKLEDTAQSIYKEWFDKLSELELLEEMTLNDICSLITDGKHGDCKNKLNSGYYFVSVKDLENGEINYNNARQITKKDFEETDRRTNFSKGDILFTNSGTIGRMVIGKENIETRKTTFQKSVAILKTKENYSESYYLYCLLKCNLKEIQELASGTSQSNLLLGSLRDFSIFHPKYIEVQNFEKQISPIFKFLEYRSKENKYLKQLKDALLSKMATIEG
jgi:type I restriction enzyme S subunit